MSNELVTSGGALAPTGVVVPLGHTVGDMSGDRGVATDSGPNKLVLLHDIQNAVGFPVGPAQIQKVSELFKQRRLEEDGRLKDSTVRTLRHDWGKNYDRNIGLIQTWLATLPESVSEELQNARDETGTPICSKPDILRGMLKAASDRFPAHDETDRVAAERELRTQWGNQYGPRTSRMKEWLDTIPHSAKEGLLSARDSEGVAIFNRPDVLRWALQLASGGGAGLGGSIYGLGSRRRQIEAMIRDPTSEYHKGPKSAEVQAEYRDLIDRGVSSDFGASVLPTNIEAEISDIEKLMRDRNSRYFKGPEADHMQRRYRELVEKRREKRQ